MGLSLLVIIAWQYFYGLPQMNKTREQQQAQQAQKTIQAPKPGQPGSTAPGAPGVAASPPKPGDKPLAPAGTTPHAPAPTVTRDRASVIAASERVRLETDSLIGSINLTGARIDDLALKKYKETIKRGSASVTLLSPAGSPNPFYVESGFVAQDPNLKLPKPDSKWTADSQRLSPGKPVTLSWDNGAGLIFKRTISIDDRYMFSVKNNVENKSGAAATLYPYALVARTGKPKTEGFYVLHEGLVGVIGESKVQEISYDGIVKETNSTRILKGTGGWIGITDKYWAAAIVPPQNVTFDGRFWASEGARKTYQTDVLEAPRTIAPGRNAGSYAPGVRRRQRKSDHRFLSGSAQNQEFRPADRLGLVLFHHQAAVLGARLHQQICRQFRLLDPDHYGTDQTRLLPSRQPFLRIDGEDEGGATGNEGDPGALRQRPGADAKRVDGALQERKDQPGCRLLASAAADSGILRAL